MTHLVRSETGLTQLARCSGDAPEGEVCLRVVGTPGQVQQAALSSRSDVAAAGPADRVCCACLVPGSDDDGGGGLHRLLCLHYVHRECLLAWHRSRLERGGEGLGRASARSIAVQCPGLCRHALTPREHRRVLGTAGLLQHVEALVAEQVAELPWVGRCRGCDALLAGDAERSGVVVCGACGVAQCSRGDGACGGAAHYFTTCEEFGEAQAAHWARKGLPEKAVRHTPELPSNMVPCKGCPALIMREADTASDGERCTYMRCGQCSYEFCWLCLRPANDHRHVDPANPVEVPACDPEVWWCTWCRRRTDRFFILYIFSSLCRIAAPASMVTRLPRRTASPSTWVSGSRTACAATRQPLVWRPASACSVRTSTCARPAKPRPAVLPTQTTCCQS